MRKYLARTSCTATVIGRLRAARNASNLVHIGEKFSFLYGYIENLNMIVELP